MDGGQYAVAAPGPPTALGKRRRLPSSLAAPSRRVKIASTRDDPTVDRGPSLSFAAAQQPFQRLRILHLDPPAGTGANWPDQRALPGATAGGEGEPTESSAAAPASVGYSPPFYKADRDGGINLRLPAELGPDLLLASGLDPVQSPGVGHAQSSLDLIFDQGFAALQGVSLHGTAPSQPTHLPPASPVLQSGLAQSAGPLDHKTPGSALAFQGLPLAGVPLCSPQPPHFLDQYASHHHQPSLPPPSSTTYPPLPPVATSPSHLQPLQAPYGEEPFFPPVPGGYQWQAADQLPLPNSSPPSDISPLPVTGSYVFHVSESYQQPPAQLSDTALNQIQSRLAPTSEGHPIPHVYGGLHMTYNQIPPHIAHLSSERLLAPRHQQAAATSAYFSNMGAEEEMEEQQHFQGGAVFAPLGPVAHDAGVMVRRDPAPMYRPATGPQADLQDEMGEQRPGVPGYVHVCHSPADALATVRSRSPFDETEVAPPVTEEQPWVVVDEKPRRRRFDEERRKQTCETRKMGTCIRCAAQRIRCEPNPFSPLDPLAPCRTCLGVKRNSKKVIHDLPCTRARLVNITVYRPPGLKLTQRWLYDTSLHDVGDWADNTKLIVKMAQGLCDAPVTLVVRRFVPRPGDVLDRRWTRDGAMRTQRLPPYALADIHATATSFKKYISDHAAEGIVTTINSDDIHPVVRRTFVMAAQYYANLPDEVRESGKTSAASEEGVKPNKEKLFMTNMFKLWFAIRHTTGSSWLCGKETLDIEPLMDPDCPERLRNKRSLPRMILEQFDRIQYNIILGPLAKAVLHELEAWTRSNNQTCWFAVYLATFMFLYEASHTSADRRRYAQENKTATAYHLATFVEQLQEGANVLLAHWQYYKCLVDMANLDAEVLSKEPFTTCKLNVEQKEYLLWMTEMLRDEKTKADIERARENYDYDHDLYFVSQMFEKAWKGRDTYRAA